MAVIKNGAYDPDIYDLNGGNDSMETAIFIDIDKTPCSSISSLNLHAAGDVDFYRITLSSPGITGDRISIGFDNAIGDLDLSLLDAEGKTVAQSSGNENTEEISFSGLSAGTYYIQVSSPFNSVNSYTLNWDFTTNNVAADALEGQEPYAITGSTELANLSISAAGDGVTREDTFSLTLAKDGNANSKIRFSNYRDDWSGMKYVLSDGEKTVFSGVGSEISLNGLSAGSYTLTVDALSDGAYSTYDLSVSLPESARMKWTYLVYIAADSNLTDSSLYDVVSMQQAAIDSEIEIYLLVDRSPEGADDAGDLVTPNGTYKWDSSWSDTRVGKITYSPGLTVTVDWESWGELNTGSIETLTRFVNWAQGESAADNYCLVLWDHGGEDATLCYDLTTDADWGAFITISEVSGLLKEKGNIPVVIFNACLLGSEITATQMTGSTDVIVVSEPTSYAQSTYNYNVFFNTVTADMTPQEIAAVMVQNVESPGDPGSFTMLSSIDVTDSKLAEALEAFAEAVAAANNDTDKTVLINAMQKAPQEGCVYDGSPFQQSDLGFLIRDVLADSDYENTSEGFQKAIADVMTALDAIVLEYRSVPSGRGSGIAICNTVFSAEKFLSENSPQKADALIKSHIISNYKSNPLWGGLLYDLSATYLAESADKISPPATFNVSGVEGLVQGKAVAVSDIGCFSGLGEDFDDIRLIDDLFLGFVITAEDKSTGGFIVANDIDAEVTVSLLASDGTVIEEGKNGVSFENLAVGSYYLRLQSDKKCRITLSSDADWWTGVDRFDYAQSKRNEQYVNGNGSVDKATSLDEGYYSGLITYKGDTDYYRIGNIHTEQYTIDVYGEEGWTVAGYDPADETTTYAEYAEGVYTLTLDSLNYLIVEGTANLDEGGLDSYSFNVVGITNGATDAGVVELDNLTGTKDEVSWESSFIMDGYTVEFSTDNFGHVIRFNTTGTAIDLMGLPAGTFQWRIASPPGNDGEWIVGEAIVSAGTNAAPQVFQSKADASDDLFFATPAGTWDNRYCAKHAGSIGGWTGTGEVISASGKGRIQDLFFGSADPGTLFLTDSEKGDALFLDDIYTGLPEEIEENTARLFRLRQIQGGAGDDIIDMTSQRFEYTGGALFIAGGDGDDVIWANKGSKNSLFGDAGNDRIIGASGDDVIVGGIGNDAMHGGGGDDIFTFCDNWGTDTVQQLESGTVTLWFNSGSNENWNAESLTYTDGDNSVTITGVAAEQVSLRFGNDGSKLYGELCYGSNAFREFTSRKIFEDAAQGVLANA